MRVDDGGEVVCGLNYHPVQLFVEVDVRSLRGILVHQELKVVDFFPLDVLLLFFEVHFD